MIDKYVNTSMYVAGRVDAGSKLASFDPEIHVPDEISRFVDGLVPDPRFAYMHTIAMSDGDAYGPNMNGDVFSWDELLGTQGPDEAAKNPGWAKDICLPRYKTFEQAKFFKHHANSPYDKSYGDVPLAVINLPMRRIELIIRIARNDIPEMGMTGAPDVCDKLDNGGVVSCSMGTRIGHEKCSYCGAENEMISQRCPHLATMMNEIMPNGVKVSASNYKPRFFDISKVTIPADPIAMSLSKVASFLPPRAPNTAVDSLGAKVSNWRQKWSEITKEIPADAVESVTAKDTEVAGPAPAPLTDAELTAISKAGSLNDALSTATALGMVYSPIELAKLASLYGESDINDIDCSNINVLSVNYGVASVLKTKFAERSGYVVAPHAGEWHPCKIASTGHVDMSDFYAFYRTAVGVTSIGDLVKAANVIPVVRSIVGPDADSRKAAAFLALAGL